MRSKILLITVAGAMLLLGAGAAFADRIPPDLTVQSQGPSKASPGQTNLFYSATVTNNGGSTATFKDGTVAARQTLKGATSAYCYGGSGYICRGVGTDTLEIVAVGDQTLGVGQSLYVSVQANAPLTSGKITYSVTADPDNNVQEVDEGNNTSDTITTYIGNPPPTDLAVSQTDNPDPARLGGGGSVRYTVKVNNNGQDTAFNALVYNTLSDNATYNSGFSNYGSCNYIASYNTVVCPLGDIPSGKSSEITLYVIPKETGTISNTATVYSDNGDPNPNNDTAEEDTAVVSSHSGNQYGNSPPLPPPPSPPSSHHHKHHHAGGKCDKLKKAGHMHKCYKRR